MKFCKETEVDVLRESMRGIQREINLRSWRINDYLAYYFGDEKRFIKEVSDKTTIVNNALKLWREIKRLRVIKAEINLIIQLKFNPISSTITTMPVYHFLYKNSSLTRDVLFQSDYTANSESELRDWFARSYNAELVAVRKGKKFSQAEIDKKRKEMKYA